MKNIKLVKALKYASNHYRGTFSYSKRAYSNLRKATLLVLFKFKLSLITRFTVGQLRSSFITAFNNFATITIGILICVGLYHPAAQEALSEFANIDNIFIGAAGLLGTFLALVPTLAIIPIQRSVEVYGSSITRLYVRDKVTQFIVIGIGIMCLLSFVMPTGILQDVDKSTLLPIQLIIICISLDLLRLHHRRVTLFLGPTKAIQSLLKEIINHIESVHDRITRIAVTQQRIFSLEGVTEQLSQSDIQRFHYNDVDKYQDWLRKRVDELFEIGTKAIMRGDMTTARLVIISIKHIATKYIHTRKDNVSFYHEANMVFNSHINKLIEPIFQRFEIMNRIALTNKMEFISTTIIENSADIISYMLQSSDENSHTNLASTIWLPLGFFKSCLEFSIKNSSDDITLFATRILTKIIQSSPNDTRHEDLYYACIGMLENTAFSYMQKENGALTNETIKEMMNIVYHAIRTNHFQLDNILEMILKSIKNMLPISLLLEKRSSHFGIPVLIAYDLNYNLSLAYLVQHSFELVKPIDDERMWLNPYRDVIDLNKDIYRHFRDIADTIQFNDSWFLWNIIETLKYISHVYLSHIRNPITNNKDHIKELVSQLQWYLAFFFSSFKIQTAISSSRAEQACESLAWIGLASIEIKQFDVAISCADNISSIINSCVKLGKSSPRQIADMYINIWFLVLIADKHNYQSIVLSLNKYNLESGRFKVDEWSTFQEQLESDQSEILKYLNNPYEQIHELDELKIILARLYFSHGES